MNEQEYKKFLTDAYIGLLIHVTNKIRGVLCSHCNTMLGMAKDSTAILLNAISYLEKHHEDEC